MASSEGLGRMVGLPGPKAVPGSGSTDQLKTATREFEAVLWETVLRSLRSAAEGLSGAGPDQGRAIYNSWLDQALARELVSRDDGMADLLYKQLQLWQARQGTPAAPATRGLSPAGAVAQGSLERLSKL